MFLTLYKYTNTYVCNKLYKEVRFKIVYIQNIKHEKTTKYTDNALCGFLNLSLQEYFQKKTVL